MCIWVRMCIPRRWYGHAWCIYATCLEGEGMHGVYMHMLPTWKERACCASLPPPRLPIISVTWLSSTWVRITGEGEGEDQGSRVEGRGSRGER